MGERTKKSADDEDRPMGSVNSMSITSTHSSKSFGFAEKVSEVAEFDVELVVHADDKEDDKETQEMAAKRIEAAKLTEQATEFDAGKVLREGLAWKLNSDIDWTEASALSNPDDWRRRDFTLRRLDKEGRGALLYVSEKNDGIMELAAILQKDKKAKPAKFESLPPATVAEMDAQKGRKVAARMYNYDL